MRAPLLVLALAGAVVLSGCTSTTPGTTPPGTTPPAGGAPPTLAFTASEYNFTGPATAAPGWTTFELRNTGQQLHHMQLFGIGTRTMAEFQSAMMAAMMAHGAPPSWMTHAGGPNAVSPGATQTAVVNLQAGTYVLVCFIPGPDGVPHVEKGMMRELKVSGAANGATPPVAEATISLKDFMFAPVPTLTAGRHVLKFTNPGAEPHEAALIKLRGNATWQDFVGAFGPNATGPPPGSGEGGITAIDPGMEQYASVVLSAGRYVWLCFEGDEAPHFTKGMVAEFTVA